MAEEIIDKDLEEKGIDLSAMFKIVWQRKKLFYFTVPVFMLLGIIVGFGIPKTYESEVVLAPEVNSGSGLSDNLSDLASMVGVNIGNSGGSIDAIYPELYPQIVSSTPFLTNLFHVRVSTADGTLKDVELFEYFSKHQKISWWNKALGGITSVFTRKKPAEAPTAKTGGKPKEDVIQLTRKEDGIVGDLKGAIKCNVDRKTSIITITVTAQDARVAASLADSVQKRLRDYVTLYRTKKARKDLAYTQKLYDESKKAYLAAQKEYAAYADANADLLLESFITQRDRLESEMETRYTLYTQLTQQLQAAEAKVQENTPVFTEIQPAVVPLEKAGPKRGSIIVGWMFLGIVLTIFYILFKHLRESDAPGQARLTAEETPAALPETSL